MTAIKEVKIKIISIYTKANICNLPHDLEQDEDTIRGVKRVGLGG
jgi:hypothetical protein